MELLNAGMIDRFTDQHHDAGKWFATWIRMVERASWKNIVDVRKKYPHADAITVGPSTVTIFNVKGNKYRLATRINYALQRLTVVAVMTHAEYSQHRWK